MVTGKELGLAYQAAVNSSAKRRLRSHELLQKLKKHFNITMITIYGNAYILENKYPNIANLVATLSKNVNDHIKDRIGSNLKSAIDFTDIKKDRDLIKALFVKATSVRFVANMTGVENKSVIISRRDKFEENISQFEKLSSTSQVVCNDMTCAQQLIQPKELLTRESKVW